MSAPARIEHVRPEDLLEDPVPTRPAPARGLGRRRRTAGLALAVLGLPLMTLLLTHSQDALSLEGQVLLYLLVVVVVALVGGLPVALVTAAVAAVLINYFFVVPVHTLTVAHADQAVALVVFVAVAGVVSATVELATRRTRAARLAQEQAQTLAELAQGEQEEPGTLREVLERARSTFGMELVALRAQDRSGAWEDVEAVGHLTDEHAPLRFDVPVGERLRLRGRGPALFAEDQRVLQAFAGAARTAYEGRRLSQKAREADVLADVDRQRTALLAAVGHDLRTPLAGIKAAVSTLRQTDVTWSPDDHDALLATIEESTDRLSGVVGNLLDASRLQAGALTVRPEAVALDAAVGAALLALGGEGPGAVDVQVAEDLPMVQADPGLLERVLVNLLDNARRHGGGGPVEVRALAGERSAKVEVVDHGPGVTDLERERLFEAFERRDDRSGGGVGLGLSVARGFVEAMGGAMVADHTPGGGLTLRLRLPLASAGPEAT